MRGLRIAAGLASLWFAGIGTASAAGPMLAPDDLSVRATPPPRVRTVAVLILSSEEAGIPLSEVYSAARKTVERHTALRVAALDAIGLAERQAAVRECAGKADCFARKVRGSAADLLLTVSVDRIGDAGELLLGLRLVDISTEQELGAAGDEIPAGMSMFGAMEDQLAVVFPKTVWNQVGDLQITSEPTNAEVNVAGQACATPCELKRLVPGTYEVSMRKSGYIDWKGSVTVLAQDRVTLSQVLEEPEGSIVSSPWFWGGIGLAAIGAGVAAALLLRSDDQLVNVCIAQNPADCSGS